MIRVYSASDEFDAHMIRGMLEENGLRCVIQGTALWGARGELPFTLDTAPSVWVADQADHDRARQLIAEHHAQAVPRHCRNCGYDIQGLPEPRCPECGEPFRRPSDSQDRICPQCGELIEAHFTDCWNCAATDQRP